MGVAECLVSIEFFLFFSDFPFLWVVVFGERKGGGKGKWYGRGELRAKS